MKFLRLLLLMIITFAFSAGELQAQAKNKTVRRYAIIIGANDGGPDRTKLRYAISDASAFHDVVSEIGSVYPEDGVTLLQPSRDDLLSAMSKMYSRIKDSKKNLEKVEFIFYYSGHSDEEGILLGTDKIYYAELKKAIQTIPADVRIAILDSCYSGAFTQMKGGKKRPPFILDTAYDMKGNAYISSSSRDEVSQESEKIKGSFFTHYFILGLRGAADMTQDSRITLNEAYQFAYRETLVKTERTMGGAQHPNYNIQMVGTGDVVLTDIAKSNIKLTLDNSIEGKILIYNSNYLPVAEFDKPYGNKMVLYFEEGDYTVINSRKNSASETNITLNGKKPVNLSAQNFTPSTPEITAMRGGSPEDQRDKNIFFKRTKSPKSVLLKKGEFSYSWYIGLSSKFSKVTDHAGIWPGLRGGLIINDSYVIGAAGYGLAWPRSRSTITGRNPDPENPDVGIGYGGLLLEKYFFQPNVVHFSLGFIIGAGGLVYYKQSSNNDNSSKGKQDSFFTVEPELNVYVNVTNSVKFGTGVSYRYIRGIDNSDSAFSDKTFGGVNGSVFITYGWL